MEKARKYGFEYWNRDKTIKNTDFINETELQPSLFFNSDPRHKSLMQTIDKLNNKFGNPVLKLAAQEFRTWKMKQEHLSPRYTTNINEVIRVRLL